MKKKLFYFQPENYLTVFNVSVCQVSKTICAKVGENTIVLLAINRMEIVITASNRNGYGKGI